MPIRFRCSMCDGLLSIARRKAGLDVECPKCGYEVRVPMVDADLGVEDEEPNVEPVEDEPPAAPPASAKSSTYPTLVQTGPERPLFEQEQIDQLLDKIGKETPNRPLTDPNAETFPAPVPAPSPVLYPGEEGVFVSRGTVAVLGLLIVVLFVLTFATGYLVGRG